MQPNDEKRISQHEVSAPLLWAYRYGRGMRTDGKPPLDRTAFYVCLFAVAFVTSLHASTEMQTVYCILKQRLIQKICYS
ncbi:hypothetical protein FACS1894111_04350 [Clostridia bacterium]|nr:hypothetical protein FACS1894111_04350 [Clostridia bacterium]